MGKFNEGVCIRRKENAALRASERPFLRTFFPKDPELLESSFFSRKMPCGNDMIDAHVENLMDSKSDHRFTTIAWKSLRLSHNHLDNYFAVIHIPTRPTTTDLICQKTRSKKGHFYLVKKGAFLISLDMFLIFTFSHDRVICIRTHER
jgi:hypothetical protein